MSFWGVGGGYKSQLSVNSIQTLQNVVGVLKKRGHLLFLICEGGGGVGREREKWHSAPHFLFHSAATAVQCNCVTESSVGLRHFITHTHALSEPIHLWKS